MENGGMMKREVEMYWMSTFWSEGGTQVLRVEEEVPRGDEVDGGKEERSKTIVAE